MPQERGELTPQQQERLAKAMQAVEDSIAERERAVAAALKAGASVREIAAFMSMSTSTVQRIGHRNGWPTDTQRHRWGSQQAGRLAPLRSRGEAVALCHRRHGLPSA